MRTLDARKLFVKHFKGRVNFMTPEPFQWGFLRGGHLLYELSEGVGIGGGKIYGVTILEFKGGNSRTQPRHDLSKCFETLKEAEEYISKLSNDQKRLYIAR